MPGQEVADFCGGGAEELAAQVDEVDPAVGELVVQAGFEADRVVAEDHGVDVGEVLRQAATTMSDTLV